MVFIVQASYNIYSRHDMRHMRGVEMVRRLVATFEEAAIDKG